MSHMLFATLGVAAAALFSFQAHALAALAGGAKTSCKITATNPIQRQIQVNADPTAVESYAMVMTYEPTKVRVIGVLGLNGFSLETVTVPTTPAAPGFAYIRVSGSTLAPRPGELDVFNVLFELLPDRSIDDLLNFQVLAIDNNDFVNGIDFDTGTRFSSVGPYHPVTNPTGINPSDDYGTVRDGSLKPIPEPAAIALLALPALGMLRRRG